jgi:diguanylate cyclase
MNATAGTKLSVGAVVFDRPPRDVDALTKASDAAMYRAKANGKNGIFINSFATKPA